MQKLLIEGGFPLRGKVRVSGSKNATLPVLAACLLASSSVTLQNVPRIADVEKMLKLLQRLGMKITWEKDLLKLDPGKLDYKSLVKTEVQELRGSIVLLGALLARFGKAELDFPGGCVLGKRPIEAHLKVFEGLGVRVLEANGSLKFKVLKLQASDLTLVEPSVTATENALLAAVLTPGKTYLRLVPTEPHIQDLCRFLNKMGAKIKGIGTPYLSVQGVKKLKGITYAITGDYLEAGTLAIAAAAVPGSHVTLTGFETKQLDAVWNKLRLTGVRVEISGQQAQVWGGENLQALPKLDTRLYPYFPTDLQSPFAVLLTRAHGVSKIFETLFEGRLNYLFELEKMGAKIEVLNPHQALVIGPSNLRGTTVTSCDLRAGAAIILAGLLAKGKTEVANINYIDRGYERLDEKLRSLGAHIERLNTK